MSLYNAAPAAGDEEDDDELIFSQGVPVSDELQGSQDFPSVGLTSQDPMRIGMTFSQGTEEDREMVRVVWKMTDPDRMLARAAPALEPLSLRAGTPDPPQRRGSAYDVSSVSISSSSQESASSASTSSSASRRPEDRTSDDSDASTSERESQVHVIRPAYLATLYRSPLYEYDPGSESSCGEDNSTPATDTSELPLEPCTPVRADNGVHHLLSSPTPRLILGPPITPPQWQPYPQTQRAQATSPFARAPATPQRPGPASSFVPAETPYAAPTPENAYDFLCAAFVPSPVRNVGDEDEGPFYAKTPMSCRSPNPLND